MLNCVTYFANNEGIFEMFSFYLQYENSVVCGFFYIDLYKRNRLDKCDIFLCVFCFLLLYIIKETYESCLKISLRIANVLSELMLSYTNCFDLSTVIFFQFVKNILNFQNNKINFRILKNITIYIMKRLISLLGRISYQKLLLNIYVR